MQLPTRVRPAEEEKKKTEVTADDEIVDLGSISGERMGGASGTGQDLQDLDAADASEGRREEEKDWRLQGGSHQISAKKRTRTRDPNNLGVYKSLSDPA